MPFDPTKPADHAPLSSAEMRGQLTSLNTEIQQRATYMELSNALAGVATNLTNAIAGTSANSNAVATLGIGADSTYNQSQIQDVINKLDELITALRRP